MRVLVVEDDRRLAQSLSRSLSAEGIAADLAADGPSALVAAARGAFEVIVLDLMLPGLDGLEVSRKLRRAGIATPILMLTARDSVGDRVAGLEAGADDYLVKPFALGELVARIRALARRHLPDRTAELRAGPVALDTAARLLRVDGRPVELTAKEFAVLEYFLLNRSRVLTRGQILENVWASPPEEGSNLVDVYVARLRRKLVRAGAGDPFVTRRGAGYRYADPGAEP